MIDEVLEAWRTNHRITLAVLEHTTDAGLAATLSTRGGRDVRGQFAHLQYVRVHQLGKRARPLAAGARSFTAQDRPSRTVLVDALEDSAARIEQWLLRAGQGEAGFRTLRKGLVPTLGYLIAHESHHRGNILLTLKQCGHPLPKALRDGLWDWNNR